MYLKHFIYPVAWLLIVALLCGLPGNSLPEVTFWFDALLRFDSAAHAAVFVVFTFLWSIAFCKQRHISLLRMRGEWIGTAFGVVYGILLEVLQYLIFVRRSAEWADMIADTAGCIAGLLLFRAVYGPALRLRNSY